MSDTPTPLPADPVAARRVFDAKFILAVMILMAVFAMMLLVLLGYAKEGTTTTMVITAAIGFGSGIVGYFFGSSAGSADKTDTLNTLVKKQP
jgi:hypothetical protein